MYDFFLVANLIYKKLLKTQKKITLIIKCLNMFELNKKYDFSLHVLLTIIRFRKENNIIMFKK